MTSIDVLIPCAELECLFGSLIGKPAAGVALAVSGGSDSTALMVLFARWLAQTGQAPAEVFVLTVDHGLRAQSGAEAEWVAQMAGGPGVGHAVLASGDR